MSLYGKMKKFYIMELVFLYTKWSLYPYTMLDALIFIIGFTRDIEATQKISEIFQASNATADTSLCNTNDVELRADPSHTIKTSTTNI